MRLTLFFIHVFTIILFNNLALAQLPHLSVCVGDTAKPPYFMGDGFNMPPQGKRGFIVDAVDEATLDLNIQITWLRLPWKRCQAGFQAGQFDSILVAVYTEKRAEYAAFPRHVDGRVNNDLAVSEVNYHFYINKEKPLGWLGGARFTTMPTAVGSPRGYVITQTLRELGVSVVDNLSPVDGFARLAQGTLSAYVYTKQTEAAILDQTLNGRQMIRRVEPPLQSTYLHMPILITTYRQHPDLFNQLWSQVSQRVQEKVTAMGDTAATSSQK